MGTRPFCLPPGEDDYFTSPFWLAPEGYGWLTAQKIWGHICLCDGKVTENRGLDRIDNFKINGKILFLSLSRKPSVVIVISSYYNSRHEVTILTSVVLTANRLGG